jgi:hypothetical protein
MPQTIPLSQTSRELSRRFGGSAPAYRQLYELILDGKLPAEQVNGRWFVDEADLPAIAATLGMTEDHQDA